MSKIEGKTLSDIIWQKHILKLSAYDLVHLQRILFEGLDQLHNAGICHCDLDASNIMVSPTYQEICFIDLGCGHLSKINIAREVIRTGIRLVRSIEPGSRRNSHQSVVDSDS